MKEKETSKTQQPQILKLDKSTKMRKNQHRNTENTKSQSDFFPPSDHITSLARVWNQADAEMDELTEVEFRIRIGMKFIELEEYVII